MFEKRNNSTHIVNRLQEMVYNGKLPCRQALALASELHVEPKQVGNEAKKLNIEITHCQLGCNLK